MVSILQVLTVTGGYNIIPLFSDPKVKTETSASSTSTLLSSIASTSTNTVTNSATSAFVKVEGSINTQPQQTQSHAVSLTSGISNSQGPVATVTATSTKVVASETDEIIDVVSVPTSATASAKVSETATSTCATPSIAQSLISVMQSSVATGTQQIISRPLDMLDMQSIATPSASKSVDMQRMTTADKKLDSNTKVNSEVSIAGIGSTVSNAHSQEFLGSVTSVTEDESAKIVEQKVPIVDSNKLESFSRHVSSVHEEKPEHNKEKLEQTTRTEKSGTPEIVDKDPREEMTKVVVESVMQPAEEPVKLTERQGTVAPLDDLKKAALVVPQASEDVTSGEAMPSEKNEGQVVDELPDMQVVSKPLLNTSKGITSSEHDMDIGDAQKTLTVQKGGLGMSDKLVEALGTMAEKSMDPEVTATGSNTDEVIGIKSSTDKPINLVPGLANPTKTPPQLPPITDANTNLKVSDEIKSPLLSPNRTVGDIIAKLRENDFEVKSPPPIGDARAAVISPSKDLARSPQNSRKSLLKSPIAEQPMMKKSLADETQRILDKLLGKNETEVALGEVMAPRGKDQSRLQSQSPVNKAGGSVSAAQLPSQQKFKTTSLPVPVTSSLLDIVQANMKSSIPKPLAQTLTVSSSGRNLPIPSASTEQRPQMPPLGPTVGLPSQVAMSQTQVTSATKLPTIGQQQGIPRPVLLQPQSSAMQLPLLAPSTSAIAMPALAQVQPKPATKLPIPPIGARPVAIAPAPVSSQGNIPVGLAASQISNAAVLKALASGNAFQSGGIQIIQASPGQFIIRSNVGAAGNQQGNQRAVLLGNTAIMLSKLGATGQMIVDASQGTPKQAAQTVYSG